MFRGTMQRLLVMDEHNYDEALGEIYRVAVRGIIFLDGRLLMIQSDFGEVKLPGGGMEEGETDEQTLIREVKEETGYDVIPDTIRPYGEIEEKRLSVQENMIWHQFSRLYFCDVEERRGECHYTENERRHGFRQVLLTLDEAIAKNEAMLQREGRKAWNRREYNTLCLIREYMEEQDGRM